MRRFLCALSAAALAACTLVRFDQPGATMDEAAYTALFPTYAEFCAVSQISKQPGFGADIRGEIGGHSTFFLQGACVVTGAHYPVLAPCEAGGAGLSMNAHFQNAKWVATPGRAMFYDGDLPLGRPMDRAGYARVQARAKQLGIYDGVTFWPEAFGPGTAGMAREDAKYEMSIGTDYAVGLARGRHCARVPVSRAQMAVMVDWLNTQNAPYRSGARQFRWSVFQDNCIHLSHNALAEAGLWEEWPINRPLLLAMLDFPVPRNEFVNIMRRTNAPLPTPESLAHDPAARTALDRTGELPQRPGALAVSVPPRRPNTVYDTDLKMIFYDEPTFGPYQAWSDDIFADPAELDLDANLRAWEARFTAARTAAGDARGADALTARYDAFLTMQSAMAVRRRALLEQTHGL